MTTDHEEPPLDKADIKAIEQRFLLALGRSDINALAIIAVEHMRDLIDMAGRVSAFERIAADASEANMHRVDGNSTWVEASNGEDLFDRLLKKHGDVVVLQAARRLPDEVWAQIDEDIQQYNSVPDARAEIARHDAFVAGKVEA